MSFNEVIDNINTRIENIISTRLPNTYQHIRIEPSNYNPSIDDTITITITVTDQSETPVTGFSVPLTVNGESVTGLTTNSNGVATYSYTCDEWGIVKFEVNSYTCFIKVTGLKQVKTTTVSSKITYTLYVDEGKRTAQLTATGSNFSIANGNENYASSGFIPSDYRPSNNLFSFISRSQYLFLYLWSNGNIGLVNWNGSTLNSQNCDVLVEWTY